MRILLIVFFALLTFSALIWMYYDDRFNFGPAKLYLELPYGNRAINNHTDLYHAFNILTSAYRRCLLDKLKSKSKWHSLHEAVQACLGQTWLNLLDIKHLQNQDDTKCVILAYDRLKRRNCTHVTLGVGNDILAEMQLKNLIPTCQFHGADPVVNSGNIFKQVGVYYPLAVGSKSGLVRAIVLENNAYRPKDVTTVTLIDFIRDYAKIDHVDHMFMDIEGSEYGLFQQFSSDRDLEKNYTSICQITVEMHGPLKDYGMNESSFDSLIHSVIEKSPFLPFWSAAPGNHLRSFYANVHDRYCVGEYFLRK